MPGYGQYQEASPIVSLAHITTAGSTNWQPLWSTYSGGNGRIDGITVKSTSADDHVVTVGWYSASGSISASVPIASAIIPANAGNGTVPLVDLLPLIVAAALAGLIVPVGENISIQLAVALGATEHLYCFAVGAEL